MYIRKSNRSGTTGSRVPTRRGNAATRSIAPMKAGSLAGRSAPRQATASDTRARLENDAGRATWHYLNQAGGGPGIVNPVDDLFLGTPPILGDTYAGGGGGGGGSRGRGRGGGRSGGGGGGGGGGVSAAQKRAYQALMSMYADSEVDKPFMAAGKAIDSASQTGLNRLAPILSELNSRAAQARTGVADAYRQGDARLAALQAQFGSQTADANQGLNQVLSAFGASPVQDTGAQALANLFANSRVANERARTVVDASMADRPQVYAGLDADVRSGVTRDQAALQARLATEQLAARREAAVQRAQLQQQLAQLGIEV